MFIQQRRLLAMPPHDCQRIVHHPLYVGRYFGRSRKTNSTGKPTFPNGPVDGTVDRLKPRGEEPLDLIIGFINRTGAPSLFFALATQYECRFGK